MPIGVDAKPAETGETKANKDVEENREVNVSKVEENKDSKADPFDDKEGGNPDNSWVDEVVVDRADADDEEGADRDGDGGEDDGQHEVHNQHFVAKPCIFIFEYVIWNKKYPNQDCFLDGVYGVLSQFP